MTLHILIEKEIEELLGGGGGGLQLKTKFLFAPKPNSVGNPEVEHCQCLCDHSLCIFMENVHLD
jgi:hypothetical protein